MAFSAPVVGRMVEAGGDSGRAHDPAGIRLEGSRRFASARLTRNPWDTRHTTGGSSAGAGAAAALNLGVLAYRTDGARFGAHSVEAFDGIFGLKPSYGRIPAYPPSPFAIVSHIGR